MNIKAFDEWKAEGRSVAKGQKACGRNERGEHIFMDVQLQPKRARRMPIMDDTFDRFGNYSSPYGFLNEDEAMDMCNPNEGCK